MEILNINSVKLFFNEFYLNLSKNLFLHIFYFLNILFVFVIFNMFSQIKI